MLRSLVIKGPAVITFNAATLFSQGDIVADIEIDTWQPESSMHGKLNPRVNGRSAKVSITPVGEWEHLGVLWPYRTALVGSSVFGADKTLVIHSLAGQKYTFQAAAITNFPEIYFGKKKTAIGQVDFTCIVKDNTLPTAVDSLLKIEAVAFPDATWAQFDKTKIVTEPPTITWDTAVPTTFSALEGVTFTGDVEMDAVEPDETGLIDLTLGDHGVMAKFTPVGITESALWDLTLMQGADAVLPGGTLDDSGFDLVVANSLGSVTLHKAAIKTAGFKFGKTTLRHGELGFLAVRTFATTPGKSDPLYTLA